MIKYSTGINHTHILRRYDKLPDKLIYHNVNRYASGFSEDVFTIFFTRDSKNHAVMYCTPCEVYRRDMGRVKSLSVEFLYNASKKHMGLGRALMEFAKIYSKQIGCGGRVNLYASKGEAFKEYPHLFYRKCGFNTGLSLCDKKMDKYLRQKVKPEDAEFPTLKMFYPPIKYDEQKTSFFTKCLSLLSFSI